MKCFSEMPSNQMFKSKRNPTLWQLFFGLLMLWNVYFYFYKPLKSKHEILKVPYGILSNPLRIKLRIPIIDNNMSPVYEYKKSDASNRWVSSNEFPEYGALSHPFKNVDADLKTLRLKEEWDSYRRKINDSIFQQINIFSKIIGDTISKRDGSLFYVHRVKRLLNSPYEKKIDLNEHGVDSVAKKWHLDYLIKDK
jgi:hypothetical protein